MKSCSKLSPVESHPCPAELLGSWRMSEILEEIKSEVDLVCIDSPPVLSVTDAVVLAPKVSGCLLVFRAGQTKRDALVQVVNRLEASWAHMYGTVINMVNVGRGYYRYYYYDRQQVDDESRLAAENLATPGMGREGVGHHPSKFFFKMGAVSC